jgi:hypothetical protein
MELSTSALDDIFALAQQVSQSEVTLVMAAESLHKSHGIKESSGRMTLNSVSRLVSGEVYKRALTIQIVEYVLSKVSEERGQRGLRIALAGLSAHIDYRNSGNVSVPGLQTVLAKFTGQIRPGHN